MEFKYIGKSLTRPDAVRKVTGKAVFLDDIYLPGMLHASILRPPTAHARIVEIVTRAAQRSPGVVKVVTGADCDIRYGDNIKDLRPMARDKVSKSRIWAGVAHKAKDGILSSKQPCPGRRPCQSLKTKIHQLSPQKKCLI